MRSLVLVLALFLSDCAHHAAQPAPTAVLDSDATWSGVCLTAEQNLLKLACKDSEGRLLGGPNKSGDPFHLVCENAEVNHVDVNPACLSTVTTCAAVSSCPR